MRCSTLKNIRVSYYPEPELLIAKIMSSIPHEGAHRQLSCEIEKEMEKMGLESSVFYSVGGARYFSQLTGVAKEADSAYVLLLL